MGVKDKIENVMRRATYGYGRRHFFHVQLIMQANSDSEKLVSQAAVIIAIYPNYGNATGLRKRAAFQLKLLDAERPPA